MLRWYFGTMSSALNASMQPTCSVQTGSGIHLHISYTVLSLGQGIKSITSNVRVCFFVCTRLTVCADVCQEFCLLLTAHLSHMEMCNLNIEGKVWPATVCRTFRPWQQLTWQVLESLYRKMINPTQLAISTTVHMHCDILLWNILCFNEK